MFTTNQDKKDNELDKLVSNRLKARRLMLGISTQEMSETIEISAKELKKYELCFPITIFHSYLDKKN